MGKRIGVVMAGGSGERFWPVSTKERPKQFLKLASPETTLLEDSVIRISDVVGRENTYIATGRHIAELSHTTTGLPSTNVWSEPTKRNTAGCLVWVAANVMATNPDDWAEVSIAVVTADQRIDPVAGFTETVQTALSAAEEHGALVTIGIRPHRPETGFGYIQVGDSVGQAHRVARFTEKPDLETAQSFIASGDYLWNSGMFFYTLGTFQNEMEQAAPELASATVQIAEALRSGDMAEAERLFDALPSISIDYALMEKSANVMVVEARFVWDDLGAWDSVARSYAPDGNGNVALGSGRMLDASENVVYNESDSTEVCLLGVEGLVVVVTGSTVLVCPKERAQEVKRFLSE